MQSSQFKGFTLVELMIAMSISIVLIGVVVEAFLSSRQAYRLQESQARMQEDARFIFHVFNNAIRQAGYVGCNSRRSGSTVNTLNNAGSFFYRMDRAIEGFEAVSNTWEPVINTSELASTIPFVYGNDIVAVRGASDTSIRVVEPFMSQTSAALHITKYNNLEQFDIVLVTDCLSASVMQITNANPHTAATIAHNTGVGRPGNATKNLGKIYRQEAEILKMVTRVFFIGEDRNSGLPTLYHKVETNSPEPLVEGVQGLQILYGEDTNGDDNVDRLLPANQVNMDQVISIKLSILLQSIMDNLTSSPQTYTFNGTTTTPTDRRVRRVFATTIALRNRLP
ncbi:MAG: PilW family protein [Gammaproteobacteria bacterium]|nr:PilW family protein [Gammaproteobacteria bacterium]